MKLFLREILGMAKFKEFEMSFLFANRKNASTSEAEIMVLMI